MSEESVEFIGNCTIKFASRSVAQELVRQRDVYTDSLTRLDLQGKVQTLEPSVSVDDYLENAQRYLHNWEQHEIRYLSALIASTKDRIEALDLCFELPSELYLIKSTMHEEGGANGFTRQNFVVLNRKSYSQHLLEHELFHIISRFNPDLMVGVFKILGFSACNEITMPGEIKDLKITNPDAPFNNFFVSLEIDGSYEEGILLIYGTREYAGGSFFGYVGKGVLLVDGNDTDKRAKRDEDGKIILLDYADAGNLFDRIGRNTNYNIHQEEVSADHFVMMLDQEQGLPDQHLVDKLKAVMRNQAECPEAPRKLF